MQDSTKARDSKWLYFNIHDLVHMRVEAGHASERSVRLVFGSFETEELERIDLTLQYEPIDLGEHSFASESYLFSDICVYIKSYKVHLLRKDDGYVLASQRDLLPFVTPVIQTLLLERGHTFVHAAAVSVNGRGVLLPGWGGTGKTSAIISLLKNVPGSRFMGDDYSILSSDGKLLSFPKAFFIYPYHRELFPHLFKSAHKPLIPSCMSGVLERVRTVVRPTIMAFPRLERLARRITPEHMQVPARKALPDAEFVSEAPLKNLLFVERYSGIETKLDTLSVSQAKKRLVGNWNYEQGRCAIDLLIGAGGTAVMDLEGYYSKMAGVLDGALGDAAVQRLRMQAMKPTEIGKAIVDAICTITSE